MATEQSCSILDCLCRALENRSGAVTVAGEKQTLLFLGFLRPSLPTINHNDMLHSGFLLRSGEEHTDVAFWRFRSLLQYGFQDTQLVRTHYQLPGSADSPESADQHQGTEFARSFQIASLFHGLPAWPWRPQDPKVTLSPQSQTRFFKIEGLFKLCKCIHVGVTSIFLCEGLFLKEINLMMCFKECVESQHRAQCHNVLPV